MKKGYYVLFAFGILFAIVSCFFASLIIDTIITDPESFGEAVGLVIVIVITLLPTLGCNVVSTILLAIGLKPFNKVLRIISIIVLIIEWLAVGVIFLLLYI